LFPASLPPGLPQNPNVLLIRTHPNPSPSVANSKYIGRSSNISDVYTSDRLVKLLHIVKIIEMVSLLGKLILHLTSYLIIPLYGRSNTYLEFR
jgi:hypothetical protein